MTRLRWGDARSGPPPNITSDSDDSCSDNPTITFHKSDSKVTRQRRSTDDSLNSASQHREGDKYDYLGRNVSVQQRRQELEPWVLIEYKKSKS